MTKSQTDNGFASINAPGPTFNRGPDDMVPQDPFAMLNPQPPRSRRKESLGLGRNNHAERFSSWIIHQGS